jgi:hypothetical protein
LLTRNEGQIKELERRIEEARKFHSDQVLNLEVQLHAARAARTVHEGQHKEALGQLKRARLERERVFFLVHSYAAERLYQAIVTTSLRAIANERLCRKPTMKWLVLNVRVHRPTILNTSRDYAMLELALLERLQSWSMR